MRIRNLLLGILIAGSAVVAGCAAKDKEKEKAEYAENLTVNVTGGKVTGIKTEDEKAAVYKGIPFAAAPVGDLRWKAPQPVTEWEGELDCSLWGANALQGDATVFSYWTEEFVQDTDPSHYRDGIVYSEDCLTLNVWSSYGVTENKPVLVYIHGGGYNSGGASCEVYDGLNVALKDVVFVSIQYRVGALGYMATDALKAEDANGSAGNYGLLDQIEALKWVQENIRTFGGNPGNVTVMGQSAGSGSVNALIASPLAEGLFKNAVAASHNSIYRDWQTVEKRSGELSLSYNGKQLSKMTVEELRAIPSEFLKGKTLPTGGPCIDGYVLTDTYKNTVADGKANCVNLMSGNVAKDDLIYSVYTSNGITAVNSMLALQNALCEARYKAGYAENTYIYMFGRDVPRALSVSEDTSGARHSYELAYFFGNYSTVSGRRWSDTDYKLGEEMTSYLVNFCKYGEPVRDVVDGLADKSSQNSAGNDLLAFWPPNKGNLYYMDFTDKAECKTMPQDKVDNVYAYYKLSF